MPADPSKPKHMQIQSVKCFGVFRFLVFFTMGGVLLSRFCLGCWTILAVSSLCISHTKMVQLETGPYFITFHKVHICCLYIHNTPGIMSGPNVWSKILPRRNTFYLVLRFSFLLLNFTSKKVFPRREKRINKNIWCPLKSRNWYQRC